MRAELMSLSGQQVSPVNPLGFLSEFDAALDPGGGAGVQQAPHTWVFSSGHTALLNLGEGDIEIEAPGGVELISGVQAAPGVRTLAPGAGEIWR